MTEDNKMSPSAFLPFCDFGGNMTSVGVKIEQFDVPVCNSFKARILNDQLCYEVDLNEYSDKYKIERELKVGFHFIMDYNEDRQITFTHDSETEKGLTLSSSLMESDENQQAIIYLDTIG